MKVILATHNYWLTFATERVSHDSGCRFSQAGILKHDESKLITCDSQLGRLMRSMFPGRHFMQLNVETLKEIQDIHNAVHNGLWSWNTTARTLTMSEMMVVFGYIYHQLRPCRLANDMGIKIKR